MRSSPSAALAMGLTVLALTTLLPNHRIFTILEVLLGVVVYVGVALADHAVTPEDLRLFRRKKVRK